MDDDGGMTAAEVVRVLDALDAAGCRYWVEGGWGVDALVGSQTRPHRDLDVDLDARHEERVLTTLAELGYAIETDWRPTRVELVAPGRGWVDVHPLQIADDGSARQADLGGGFWEIPARCYTTGRWRGARFRVCRSRRSCTSMRATSCATSITSTSPVSADCPDDARSGWPERAARAVAAATIWPAVP